jgi:hypothetical protein
MDGRMSGRTLPTTKYLLGLPRFLYASDCQRASIHRLQRLDVPACSGSDLGKAGGDVEDAECLAESSGSDPCVFGVAPP